MIGSSWITLLNKAKKTVITEPLSFKKYASYLSSAILKSCKLLNIMQYHSALSIFERKIGVARHHHNEIPVQ